MPEIQHRDGERTVSIGNVELKLSTPVDASGEWIGQREVLQQLLACWLVVAKSDLPLAPRLTGVPGIGKTTLAMAAAETRKQPLYIYQCTADTRPEDLLITPVLSSAGKIRYQASPLVTAMIVGGICVLDEGNRMNEKSWASLASLLDHRRYIESIVAGINVPAHADFRCCATMNEDESVYEIPDYILSRLQPTLKLGYPNKQDELAILKYHLPFAADELLGITVQFLQQSHDLGLTFSPRDGINVLRYALKRMMQSGDHFIAKDEVWREALVQVLGDEALDLGKLANTRKKHFGDRPEPLGLGDFFFDEDDPLHPDREDNDDDD